jgi:hypothetical protein
LLTSNIRVQDRWVTTKRRNPENMGLRLIALQLFLAMLTGVGPIYSQDFSRPNQSEFNSAISKPQPREAFGDSGNRILGQTGVLTASSVTEGARLQHEVRIGEPTKNRGNMLLEVPGIFAAFALLLSVVPIYFYRARHREKNVHERTATRPFSRRNLAVEAIVIPSLREYAEGEIPVEDEEHIKC